MSWLRSDRFEGLLWLLALGGLVVIVLSPKINAISVAYERIEIADTRLQSHKADLARPLTSAQPTEYASYAVPPEHSQSVNVGILQAALVETVQSTEARLVDLRIEDGENPIAGLETLYFRLELEGDLRSTLETLERLGGLSCPLHVDTLEMRPVGQFDRLDRRIRMSMALSCWKDKSS